MSAGNGKSVDMKEMTENRKNLRRSSYLQLFIGIVFLLLLNLVGSFVFYRFDLTSEKRYSLSPATRTMLKQLDDVVYFKIYLDGDFPAGFTRLKNETREMLNQFRAYTDNIQYEFIDPSASTDKTTREALYTQLVQSGLNPTNLNVRDKGGVSSKLVFPGAIVSYREKEIAMPLLITQVGKAPEEVLNNSVQALEYNIANTIRKLNLEEKPKIAFIEGHGELVPLLTAGIEQSLSEFYTIEHVRINNQLSALTKRTPSTTDSSQYKIENKYKAIIVAKPDSAFSKDERDKFIIDQFIMRGGKVLWLVDGVTAEMDSLRLKPETIGLTNELNLEDMFFNYGVRINSNLIVDMNALPIPVVVDAQKNQKMIPWLFFPVLIPQSQHPIVRNLNAIKSEFISSIDTVECPGIKKTVLLTTSRYSRVLNTPVMIRLAYLHQQPDVAAFNQPYQPVAVLLEGEFVSLFLNRIPPELAAAPEVGFVGKSKATSMIVVADGDIIKNQVQMGETGATPMPLGYDRHTRQQFGNQEFILNAMNFLCDDSGLLSVRSREVKLRTLDTEKVEAEKLKWQLINTVLPILLILAYAFAQAAFRRYKYTR